MGYRALYEKFLELDIDRSLIGLSRDENKTAYFCTPMGAEIICCLEVDGIHFCFIPHLDIETVFVVSPMPCGKHYVEPVANNFSDFLSLILSCGGSSPLEQISWISEAEFFRILETDVDNFIDVKAEELYKIQCTFGIQKLTNPYRYVKSIQECFNYSSIPFSDEYYDVTGRERL